MNKKYIHPQDIFQLLFNMNDVYCPYKSQLGNIYLLESINFYTKETILMQVVDLGYTLDENGRYAFKVISSSNLDSWPTGLQIYITDSWRIIE